MNKFGGKVNMRKIVFSPFRGIIICITVVIIIACYLYHIQVKSWNDKAREVFREALVSELQKRSDMSVEYYCDREANLSMKEHISEIVSIKTEDGEKKYKIPAERISHSIVKDTKQRSLLTFVLEEKPLASDTLCEEWNHLLKNVGVLADTRIRISILDLQEIESSRYSKNAMKALSVDSLISYYVGFRCETEVTGFISYSWLNIFKTKNIIILCLSFVITILIYCRGGSLISLLKRRLYKEKVRVEKEIVVEEKIVPIAMVELEKSTIFQLEDGVIFDEETKVLKRSEVVEKLFPQVASLLKLFIIAEEHRLSVEEIDKGLWQGHGSFERMHTAIRRLRIALSKVSHLIIEYENGFYQLKTSLLIESLESLKERENELRMVDTNKK